MCCEKKIIYLFIYKNNKVYGICDDHFESEAHQCFVECVIDIKNNKKYKKDEIFKERKIEALL